MTYDEIVIEYIRTYRDGARDELRGFERELSLSAAIRRAALCQREDGKRYSHQRRISGRALENAELQLQSAEGSLANVADFDELYRLIDETIGRIDGIGALTVYDIAHRIGAYLGQKPARVYLHAGTKVGALALGIEGDEFDPKILPKPFSRLLADEIEDCLCIFKEKLKGSPSENDKRTSSCVVARRARRCLA